MTPGAQSYLSSYWPDPEYSGGSGHIPGQTQYFNYRSRILGMSDKNKMCV